MEIVFLGTSGCVPTKDRNLSSIFLEYLDEYFLFDCGEGTQRQMRYAGINFMKIEHVFITHLHADHFLGLAGMIQSMDFLEREDTLHIYGPQGLGDTMRHLLSTGTFRMDSLTLEVHEVSPGVVLEGKRYVVSCYKTEHTSGSLGYVFQEKEKRTFLKKKALELGVPEGPLFSKLQEGESIELEGERIEADQVLSTPVRGRKVVYTGDTRPIAETVKAAKDADLLIHDGTFSDEDLESIAKLGHSTARQAAEIAKKAGAKRLYLTHISQRYPDAACLAEEAKTVFPESYVAEDLMRLKVEKHTS